MTDDELKSRLKSLLGQPGATRQAAVLTVAQSLVASGTTSSLAGAIARAHACLPTRSHDELIEEAAFRDEQIRAESKSFEQFADEVRSILAEAPLDFSKWKDARLSPAQLQRDVAEALRGLDKLMGKKRLALADPRRKLLSRGDGWISKKLSRRGRARIGYRETTPRRGDWYLERIPELRLKLVENLHGSDTRKRRRRAVLAKAGLAARKTKAVERIERVAELVRELSEIGVKKRNLADRIAAILCNEGREVTTHTVRTDIKSLKKRKFPAR